MKITFSATIVSDRIEQRHSDIAFLNAPIRIWKYLDQNFMTVEPLSVEGSRLLQVKFDHHTQREQMNKISYVFVS